MHPGQLRARPLSRAIPKIQSNLDDSSFSCPLAACSCRSPLNLERRALRRTDIFFGWRALVLRADEHLFKRRAQPIHSLLVHRNQSQNPVKPQPVNRGDDGLADSQRQAVVGHPPMKLAIGAAHRLNQGGILRQRRKDCRRTAPKLLRPRLRIGKAVLQQTSRRPPGPGGHILRRPHPAGAPVFRGTRHQRFNQPILGPKVMQEPALADALPPRRPPPK